MKRTITLFSIAVALSLSASAQFVIPVATKAPTIDGLTDGDAWTETWVDQALEKAGSSTHDMSSKFQIQHDADNIYVIIRVQDATPNNDAVAIPNSYERDCQELFFSMHSVTEATAYAAGDWQIRHQRAGDVLVDGSGTTAAEFTALNFVAAVDDDGASTYTIEYKLSKATLAGESDFDGVNLRMDFQTADNTTGAAGGRTQQMFWGDASDLQWNNVNLFIPVTLAPIDNAVNENAKILPSARISNNQLVVKNMTGTVSVYDLTGKLVLTADANESKSVSSLTAGLYIVTNNNFSTKVVKK